MTEIRKGRIYAHFKGDSYVVEGEALHTETREDMVIYRSLMDGKRYVRPSSMFMGEVEVKGEKVPRFWAIPGNRLGWDAYFMNIAEAVSLRSTCIRRQYGAVIVKDNVIVSTGYNGSARGEVNCIEKGTCLRQDMNIPSGERYELCAAVHAEQNAIINGDPGKMRGATIYVAGKKGSKPCLMCSRAIKNAMISRVVYYNSEGMISSMLIS